MSKKKAAKRQPQLLLKSVRQFVGYLEGTQKAHHTVQSYRIDLLGFCDFARTRLKKRELTAHALSLKLFEDYGEELKKRGLKTNTRRRILMTLRRFIRFLKARRALQNDWDMRLPTPQKVERVPKIVEWTSLRDRILALPQETFMDRRNQALFLTLLETGAQVAEVATLRPNDFTTTADGALVKFSGKRARSVPVSRELYELVQGASSALSWCFPGCNKIGPLPAAISSRGVELLIRDYAERLGDQTLVPRAFRHAYVVHRWREGLSKDDIQTRLGLLSQYSFRLYEPIFRSSAAVTPR